jgi:hypothetical protein
MLNSLLLLIACSTPPSLQVKVDGEGYFRLIHEGRAVYAKEAKLSVSEGRLANSAGDFILPVVQVPADASALSADLEGNIYASRSGNRTKIGQFVLAVFSPSAVLDQHDGVLVSNERPHLGNPGEDTLGVIRAEDTPGSAHAHVVKDASTTAPATALYVIPQQIARQITAPTPKAVQQNVSKNVTPAGVQIAIAEHSAVSGNDISLADLAAIEGEEAMVSQLKKVSIGNTPPAGIKRPLDRSKIVTKLRGAGFKPEDFIIIVPTGAEVHRKGQTVPNSQFVTAAVQAIMDHHGAAGSWECSEVFPDFEAPLGKIDLRGENVTGADTGTATVTVGVFVGETRYNSRTLHLTLKNQIPPVRSGSAIKVVLRAGKAQVEVPGIAKTAGKVGEMIEVEVRVGNPPVTTLHTGMLTAPGVVEVRL